MRLRFLRTPAVAALLLAALFVVANLGAFDGYFSDDDLDNLGWNSFVGIDEYGRGICDVLLSPHNFRPAGHIFYWVLVRLAGLDFTWYVGVILALHLANSALVCGLLRKLDLPAWPALAATAMWAFHPALVMAHWKPMYVFDLVCGTFCLLTLHSWLRGRWVWAVLAFWCAYKAKEIAVFLPAAIALYEFTVGQKRWKPLLPLLAISASFGLQALLAPRGAETPYTLRVSFDALRTCLRFYGPALGVLTGVAMLAGLSRRTWWALGGFLLLMVPLLILPGRLFAVYLYVPSILAAVLIGQAASAQRWPVVLAFLILAGYQDHRRLREFRREELAGAVERQRYVETLARYLKARVALDSITLSGTPASMNPWGPEGAVHLLSRRHDLPVVWKDSPDALRWDQADRQLKLPGLP